MDRLGLLDAVLGHLADGAAPQARELCLAAAEQEDDAVGYGLAALAEFWLGDFAEAGAHAALARARASDHASTALALAVTVFARAGDADAQRGPGADPIAEAVSLVDQHDDGGRWWAAMVYLVTEGALVSARLDDAARCDAASRARPAEAWGGHPFAVMMAACTARVAAFSGRINDATAALAPMRAVASSGRLPLVMDAVDGLILGNADDPAMVGVRDRVLLAVPDRLADFVDRGILLLLAFGAIAAGDRSTAAALVLRAGGDEGLSRCTIIDRSLGLELLLVAALEEGDLEAASSWTESLALLAHHPIAAPTVDRALSRMALARGDAAEAVRLAERSVEGCRAHGRAVEAAEGEIVLATARIAGREVASATRSLRALVAASDHLGHAAVRRSAGATLGVARRRLPPVAGAGWAALSDREADVGRRILQGAELETIARDLHLSSHTVRVHASRVLCAFGVPSRIGLLAAVGGVDGPVTPLPAPLSPRQSEVAGRVAHGRSNAQVAAELGVSVKAVEKHVGDVLVRWDVASRFEIARIWWAAGES
jgi:DNA-binding NarL/FixJ family response regulator